MNLYEFSAIIRINMVVAAYSEESARKEIDNLSADGWVKNGEVLELIEAPELDVVRKAQASTLEQLIDEANIVAAFV